MLKYVCYFEENDSVTLADKLFTFKKSNFEIDNDWKSQA